MKTLRLWVTAAIALFCWTKASLGFVPVLSRSATSKPGCSNVMLQANILVEEEREELVSKLPEADRKGMSKMEIEFRELLEGILYTPEELSAITNPRVRTIYEGITASYYEPAIYRAFEVLYEDYVPLRVGGRLVYSTLQKNMKKSLSYREFQIREANEALSLPSKTIASSWDAFITLSRDKEMDVGIVKQIISRGQELQLFRDQPEEELILILNPDGLRKLSFASLLKGICHISEDISSDALAELFNVEIDEDHELDSKQMKYRERYDGMLVKFDEWKPFLPSGEGRRYDILKGCFVGSENESVVAALRVIYTDYKALRLSGDWIFQVVSALMKAAMKRQEIKQ